MKTPPPCILYSRDEELTGRLTRIASGIAAVQSIDEQAELDQWFTQFGDAILLADLRAPNCLDALSEIKAEWPLTVIIVIGADRSDPMLVAEWLAPFAAIGLEPERADFLVLLKHAIECYSLRKKSFLLEAELAKLSNRKPGSQPPARTPFPAPLQNFSKLHQNFGNGDVLFGDIVDGLAATARVSRAGIFIRSKHDEYYTFRAGMRCLQATESLVIPDSAPFVRWLEKNARLTARQALDNIQDPEERDMLKRMLDSLGAEIIIPLYAASRIQGWVFVGQRTVGIPFDVADLEDLAGLGDHISTTLEKALQYEETVLQKSLAETLLHTIPIGIIACDENAFIRWFNSTARDILRTEGEEIIGQQVESAGGQIADMLRRTLQDKAGHETREWTDSRTKRTLSADTCRLIDGHEFVGAMMILRDATGAKLLQEKEGQLERTAFWTDLAASMSHEIRNPLVAIKTFSQLLPERYDDPDFRTEFGEQVIAEVDRLNQIIDKINHFAQQPHPVFVPLDIRKPIEHAITRLQSEFEHENLNIHLSADGSTLKISGDSSAMEECLYHLLRNSAENLNNKEGSHISVAVKSRDPQQGCAKVFVTISDNGSGIDASVRDKLFSPFSTIKARGLGLGLPIAKRAIIDHNGQMDINTSEGGTSITLTIPALSENHTVI